MTNHHARARDVSVPGAFVQVAVARLLERDDVARAVVATVASRIVEYKTPGFLDVDGAAAFLSCPKSRVYALVSARRIPHHRDGSRLLFDRDELRAYVRNGGAKRP
jgi:excisionase family DNA binding protein